MEVFVNGRFLGRRITGVERFGRETLAWLDDHPEEWGGLHFTLLIPRKMVVPFPSYSHIAVIPIGSKGNYRWEQITLKHYCLRHKADYLLNLCNLAPIGLSHKNIATVHDVSFKIHPEFFKWYVAKVYQFLMKRVIERSVLLFTDTETSKKDILANYPVSESKIVVVGCGVNPNLGSKDEAASPILSKVNGPFYFSVGSRSPNKNLRYIAECAKRNPDKQFLVSGGENQVFDSVQTSLPANLHCLGYLSDSDIRVLYSKCDGFIFPSFSEGFGLPPLEAVSCGCRSIVLSDISVFHEIFGDSATYIDPHNMQDFPFLKKMTSMSEEDATRILQKYSWHNTAESMLFALKKLAN
jgi:glycosyltransferase involved in cell wall biosynthesis